MPKPSSYLNCPLSTSDLKRHSNIRRHGKVHNPEPHRRTPLCINIAYEPEIPEPQQLHKQHLDAGAAEEAAGAGMRTGAPGQVVTRDGDVLVLVLVAGLLAQLAEAEAVEGVGGSCGWVFGVALVLGWGGVY